MANSNTKISISHQIHSILQSSRLSGFWIAGVLGCLIAGALVVSAFATSPSESSDASKSSIARLSSTEAAISKLNREKAALEKELADLTKAPEDTQTMALQSGGYTEDDVGYWRKQMEAYSLMSGVRLTIVGRGPSNYKDATKLTVSLMSNSINGSSAPASLSTSGIIKALDFLQLYGYVESFNGSDAVVHIAKKAI